MLESDPDLMIHCVAEQADITARPGLKVTKLGPRRTVNVGGALLPVRIALAARQQGWLAQSDVVHHGLPFAAGRTFSFLIERAWQLGLATIVGPVQAPLEWTGDDELPALLSGGLDLAAKRVTQRASNAVWPLIKSPVRRMSARTLRRATRVVPIDRRASDLVQELGVEGSKIRIIPPPMRLQKLAMNRTWPSTDEPLRMVTAGYLIRRKRVQVIIKAVEALLCWGHKVELVVAGDGPDGPALRRLLSSSPACPFVRCVGWLEPPDLVQLLMASHVYVTMSCAEGWSAAVAEALGCGLVVVSANNAGARSQVDAGAPIRLVPQSDLNKLVDTLAELRAIDVRQLESLGEAGLRWARQNLTPAVVASRWLELYDEALKEKRDENHGI
jgi:glycosyltransferase involved in cell wall biosynthesis